LEDWRIGGLADRIVGAVSIPRIVDTRKLSFRYGKRGYKRVRLAFFGGGSQIVPGRFKEKSPWNIKTCSKGL
jgi:hypothetical protein